MGCVALGSSTVLSAEFEERGGYNGSVRLLKDVSHRPIYKLLQISNHVICFILFIFLQITVSVAIIIGNSIYIYIYILFTYSGIIYIHKTYF